MATAGAAFETFANSFLTCPLCLDLLVSAKIVNCGHTFCEDCVENLKIERQFESVSCPLCQVPLQTILPATIVDRCIEHLIESHFSSEGRLHRAEMLAIRAASREERQSSSFRCCKCGDVLSHPDIESHVRLCTRVLRTSSNCDLER